MKKNAVVLFSGGIDSSTCLAMAIKDGYNVYALTIDYGQKHSSEIKAAQKIAKKLGVANHLILNVPLNLIGQSALTDDAIDVSDANQSGTIPSTYVPARNTIFLSLALGYAEVTNAETIYIGINSADYTGYPDCRPEYISTYEQLANLATKTGVSGNKMTISTPLATLTKAGIIKAGAELGLDFSLTVTCYRANGKGEACGKCDSCAIRKKGFEDANVTDNTSYYAL